MKVIQWPHIISNTELWEFRGQKSIILQTALRKLRWIRHTLRKRDKSTEEEALDWNPQGTRRIRRPQQNWERTVLEDALKCDKTWSEVKKWAGHRVNGDASEQPCVPNGTKGHTRSR